GYQRPDPQEPARRRGQAGLVRLRRKNAPTGLGIQHGDGMRLSRPPVPGYGRYQSPNFVAGAGVLPASPGPIKGFARETWVAPSTFWVAPSTFITPGRTGPGPGF